MRVEIYTKPDCPLCDEGKELVEAAQDEAGFELILHNILTRDDWFAEFRYSVPVVFVDGRRMLELRFTAEELAAALLARRAGDHSR
jgi:glutaredoxin